MDIKMYFGKRTQKEQSDKSNGEELGTVESLYYAQRARHS